MPYLPRIDVCVPLRQGAVLACDRDALEAAGCRFLLAEDTAEPYSGDFVARIAALRNALKTRVSAPFWLSLDHDTRLSPETLRDAAFWVTVNREWAGVGLWSWDEPIDEGAHVGAACALHRTAATEGFAYGTHLDGERTCECGVFTYTLRRAGWIYRYHPTLRVEHGADNGD